MYLMRNKKTIRNTFVFIFLLLGLALKAQVQEKHELRPYTVTTTYEKLKKDYPFIQPVEPLISDEIVARENQIYKKVNGNKLKADVYMPKVNSGETYPAVLLIHGGGWLTGIKENEQMMAQHLAKNGYVGVAAAYRLGTEAKYPASVLDLKDVLKWMRENAAEYHINPYKIAVLGASSGAHLATLLGVTPNTDIYKTGDPNVSDKVQAIVNIDGIVSFIHPDAEEGWMAATWFGGSRSEKYELWKEASPLEYVDKNTPPTLFINSAQPRFHAGRDDMISILDTNKIYNEVHTIPDSPHSFWLMHPWFDTTLEYTVNFLNKTLKYAPDQPYREITVSKDGKGDFASIQEAINFTRDLGPAEVIIHIKNGTYNEKIEIPAWKHRLTLVGENRKNTIITNADFSGKINPKTGKEISTFTSSTLLVEGNDIQIQNLTIKNSSCNEGQAVALHVEGDRFIIKDCDILGCQDTIYTAREASRQLYYNCYIEGTTDFIFGEATAVFKNCTIKSFADSYVTAAATPQNREFGYVFINCKLIAAQGVKEVYLGRPWRPYAKTVFINTEMGSHIRPEGWNPWKGDAMFPNKEETAYYAEYNSTGAGAAPENRVSWSHQLTSKEAEKYSIDAILNGSDHWNPLYAKD
jgi:pectin methylesterase-like acyl-CoA thioesterase/acetyl esterase/lipase